MTDPRNASPITVKLPDGTVRKVPKHTQIAGLARDYPGQTADYPILVARVDNKLHSLSYQLRSSCRLEFHTYRDPEGMEVYRRTLGMILVRAVMELKSNTRLVVEHSLGNGYFYKFYTDTVVNEPVLEILAEKMREIIDAGEPIVRKVLSRAEAVDFFASRGQTDKVRLLRHGEMEKVAVYSCGPFTDVGHGPLAPSTGFTKTFALKPYHAGFVLLFPEPSDMRIRTSFRSQRKLFTVYNETKRWARILAVNNVGRLNDTIHSGQAAEFIRVAEALHEKKIAQIADSIAARPEVKLILIAGPTSSGKTTFARRLSIQLLACGLRPVALGMDDYFLDREKTPLDEDGQPDYEILEALDLDLFNRQLPELLSGHEVEVPRFDFTRGCRAAETRPIRLDDDQILVVEGIHGLNPKLTYSTPQNQKVRIYISPLTQLSLDDFNRIPTTDTRLLRRIVRDHKFRNQRARGTLEMWPRVRRGEERNIFPFQEESDLMFNSALPYELAVLKVFAQPLLQEIEQGEPIYNEARRLLRFQQFFLPLDTGEIPRTSLLREFIGGSCFQ